MTDRTVPTEPTPCPVCGGKPTIHGNFEYGFLISHTCEHGANVFRHASNTEADAIAVWNRRAASPGEPGAEVEPVGTCVGDGVFWHRNITDNWPVDGTPLYLSPPTTDAIRAQARREALEEAERSIKRLKGTLSYIAAQAKAGYPTALSVIRANAESALDDEWQKTVSEAQALLSKKVDDQ
ncbi:MAG: Lar family restriction alleviation protein [Armatimonadia bacterium]